MNSDKETEDTSEVRMDVSGGGPGEGEPPPDGSSVDSNLPDSASAARDTSESLAFAVSAEDMANIQHHAAAPDLSSPSSSSRQSSSPRILLKFPNSDASPSDQQPPAQAASATTSPLVTSIPIATPIFLNSQLSPETWAWSNHHNILTSLHACYSAPNPLPIILSVRQELYGLPSLVKRLVLDKRLREHEGCVNCINFSWQGDLLASGSDDLQVVLWDWRRGKVASKFDTGHVANVFQAKFMPLSEDRVLVTASRDGKVRCHTLSSTGELHHSSIVGSHSDSAHKLSIEPDSRFVFLSSGEDGSVLQIDLRESNTRNKILVCRNDKNRKIPLYSIFTDPSDNNYFAVSGQNQYARIYDRRSLQSSRENSSNEGSGDSSSRGNNFVKMFCPDHLKDPCSEVRRANITCLVYSHNGNHLLCSYNDEDIYLFDARHSSGSNYMRKYSGHRNNATVKGVNFFGLRSEYVVSGSDCGHVFLWDTDRQDIVQCMEGDMEGVVNCLEPHPHIPVLATSGLDHDVKIFSPTAVQPTNLDGIDTVVEGNKRKREEARSATSDGAFSFFAELLLQRYGSRLRERARLEADADSDDSIDTPSDGDDEDEGPRQQCIQQ